MKKNLKVMLIILVIGSMLVLGVSKFKTTNTYEKYKLVVIAKLQGATIVSIDDGSVTYELGDSHMTVYEAGYSYAIRGLSGK